MTERINFLIIAVFFLENNCCLQKSLLSIVRVPENSLFAEIIYLLFIREN